MRRVGPYTGPKHDEITERFITRFGDEWASKYDVLHHTGARRSSLDRWIRIKLDQGWLERERRGDRAFFRRVTQ